MTVAVTGATGFLGLHLLAELLTRHRSCVVLARAGSGVVLERVARFLTVTGAPTELRHSLADRVRVAAADLTLPRMGMSAPAFQDLADRLDAVWHCAADTTLNGDLDSLRRVNVYGTRSVLDLVAAGQRAPRLYHVSTAFVAGARRDGVVFPHDLTDAHGFENAYQRSKYEAERLIHAWAVRHGHPAVIFRPSILATDRPYQPGLPSHTLLDVDRVVAQGWRLAAESGLPVPSNPRIRLPGDPEAHLNFLPVEQAAAAMARLARHQTTNPVETYHVVNDRDVPVTTLVEVLSVIGHAQVSLAPEAPPAPSFWEEVVAQVFAGFHCHLWHRRRFDDTRERRLLGDSAPHALIDRDYLLSGVRGERHRAS